MVPLERQVGGFSLICWRALTIQEMGGLFEDAFQLLKENMGLCLGFLAKLFEERLILIDLLRHGWHELSYPPPSRARGVTRRGKGGDFKLIPNKAGREEHAASLSD